MPDRKKAQFLKTAPFSINNLLEGIQKRLDVRLLNDTSPFGIIKSRTENSIAKKSKENDMGIKKGKEGRDDRAEGLSLRRSKQMAGVTPFAEGKPGRESLSAYERPRVWRGACQGAEIKLSMKNVFLSPRLRT